jgi:hypothetical protein
VGTALRVVLLWSTVASAFRTALSGMSTAALISFLLVLDSDPGAFERLVLLWRALQPQTKG